VGKHDRRNSLKMRRRKGQVKKKARLKRRAEDHKAATAQPGKKAPRKPRAVAAPPASVPVTAPEAPSR
jgi:hypothetical protein